MREALLYKKLDSGLLECFLCSHYCKIADKKFGFCGMRQNLGGVLYTHSYAKLAAAEVDPVEKKPLYHFLPGSLSFSIACAGCNFRCGFCQNWQISQMPVGRADLAGDILPEEVVAMAVSRKCRSIAYTYTEPTIFLEYALEAAKLAKAQGLRNIFVTNGYMSPQAVALLKPYLDAANIDLKSFSNNFYKKNCAAELEPVLDSIRLMKDLGIWVEVTTLVVPGENDSAEELTSLAGFLAGVDKFMPWHVSAFHPDYKFLDYAATPGRTLKQALEIGASCGLKHVYAGNVRGYGSDTYCPECKKLIIQREGFRVLQTNLNSDRCAACQAPIRGIFS